MFKKISCLILHHFLSVEMSPSLLSKKHLNLQLLNLLKRVEAQEKNNSLKRSHKVHFLELLFPKCDSLMLHMKRYIRIKQERVRSCCIKNKEIITSECHGA